MNILILILSYIIMLIGVLGCFLPFLPGTPLVFAGIFLYAWKTHFMVISHNLLIIFLIIAIITVILDYIAGSIGAKKLGATKFGVVGAFLGVIVGIFFAPWGVFIGPPLGALIGELIRGKKLLDAMKASGGAILGILGGTLTKVVASLIMIGFFTARLF
ncbi:DUF456 domain-containing protein [candidate division WOR-3 bacterium]|nr:DUF456 domain-containing protein [candidate division WOR-3 bacterium]